MGTLCGGQYIRQMSMRCVCFTLNTHSSHFTNFYLALITVITMSHTPDQPPSFDSPINISHDDQGNSWIQDETGQWIPHAVIA